MNTFFFIPAFLIVIFCSLSMQDSPLTLKWGLFKQQHDKAYSSPAEENERRKIWEDNHDFVEKQNAMNLTFKLAVHKHADLTHHEFVAKRTGLKVGRLDHAEPVARGRVIRKRLSPSLPVSFDLRASAQNCVTSVKDQGMCGSCWTFASAGALECQLKKKTGKLISLSEQQFLDCDQYNFGCDGGWPAYAFQYAKSGINPESIYPYNSKASIQGLAGTSCQFKPTYSSVKTNPTGYTSVTDNNDQALMTALVNVGSVTAVVCVNMNFQYYSEGVFTDKPCIDNAMNHAILVVGYGVDSATKTNYWIVKNSWGANWAEKGYIRIARGKGLVRSPVYPNV